MMGKHLVGGNRSFSNRQHCTAALAWSKSFAMTQRKHLRVPHYPPHPAQSSPQTQTAKKESQQKTLPYEVHSAFTSVRSMCFLSLVSHSKHRNETSLTKTSAAVKTRGCQRTFELSQLLTGVSSSCP